MSFALSAFQKIQSEHSQEFKNHYNLVIKTGTHLNSSVLKLLKDNWTLDDHTLIKNTCGVFFGLWLDHAGRHSNTVQYNIHAIKLARLGDHKIKARDFAASFRKTVKRDVKDWPAISFDFGPLTLLQGSFPLIEDQFEKACITRMSEFVKLCPIIDGLLANHQKSVTPA